MRPADKPSSAQTHRPENPRASRVDHVIEYVKTQITDGVWTAGSRLPNENEVARTLGVSRTPVREAIKILAAAGLLETRQGHGTFVRSRISVSALQLALFQIHLEKTTPQKLMEVRELFEVACVELAAQRRTSNDLVAMEIAIQRLREEAAKRPLDRQAALEADISFHRAVYAATHNELIQAIANLMLEMITPYIGKSHEAGQLQQSIRLHEMMLEAIAAHDRADHKLMRSVRANMDHFRQTLEPRAPAPTAARGRSSGAAR
jgi:DNA-binding FadR family transcriptional regulator